MGGSGLADNGTSKYEGRENACDPAGRPITRKETSRRPLRDRHDSRRSSEDYQTHPENTMKTIHDEHQQQTSRRGHDPLGVRDDPM